MSLKSQRRIAAQLLKAGINRIWFDPNRLDEIKEAITKADIRSLIGDKAIQARPKIGVSRYRVRQTLKQKRKGRKSGKGSRKGTKKSRLDSKREWILKVRTQRAFIQNLKTNKLVTSPVFRQLYLKVKGGFFRSVRHIKIYMNENKLIVQNGKK